MEAKPINHLNNQTDTPNFGAKYRKIYLRPPAGGSDQKYLSLQSRTTYYALGLTNLI